MSFLERHLKVMVLSSCRLSLIIWLNLFIFSFRFENDRTISFIPPDGEFELMSYRLNTHVSKQKVCHDIDLTILYVVVL